MSRYTPMYLGIAVPADAADDEKTHTRAVLVMRGVNENCRFTARRFERCMRTLEQKPTASKSLVDNPPVARKTKIVTAHLNSARKPRGILPQLLCAGRVSMPNVLVRPSNWHSLLLCINLQYPVDF